MKVLLLNTLYPPDLVGGAERSTHQLVQALPCCGVEPVVVATQPKGSAARETYDGKVINRVLVQNLYRPFQDQAPKSLKFFWHVIDSFNPWMEKELLKIIKQERPDVIHTNNLAGFSVAAWNAARKSGIPVVHTLRDYYLLCPKATMYHNVKNCQRRCALCKILSCPRIRATKKVATVVGISRFILDRHIHFGGFPGSLKAVIHNSYAAEKKCPTTKEKSGQDLVFGYLGRLESNKGVEAVLHAFNKIGDCEARLLLAGSGDAAYIENLKSRFNNRRITFLGFCDPKNFFAKIQVLVFPSLWHEPLGRGILEAYAYGVPVIGSNRGGIPEIIDHGRTGFVFNPEEVNGLAGIMIKFINQEIDLTELSRNAEAKSGEFSPLRIAAAYRDLYAQVM